jgi:hypothetical protein
MHAEMQMNNHHLSLEGNISANFGDSARPHMPHDAGFNREGFNGPGFNGGRFNGPSFHGGGSNGAGFNGGGFNGAGFNGAHNPSAQMSDMAGNYSKSSFSVESHNTANGQSSTYFAQGTQENYGDAGRPQFAHRSRDDDRSSHYEEHSVRYDERSDCDHDSGRHHGGNDSGRTDQSQWTNTDVSNNQSSINLGDYKLDLNKADSSMVVTNTKTGDTTKVWGDPHIDQHANTANKTSDMFNGPMTFMLPDNTKITVGTQAAKNNPSVSFADDLTITRGNQAYQVKGLSEQDSAGLTVQKSYDGRALDAATPDGYTIQAKRDGSGWIDPTTGQQPTGNDFKKAA